MKLKAVTKVTDAGWKEILKTVKRLKDSNNCVKVGVLGSSKERREGGVTNVELAMIHEFGAPAAGIPERSFIRSTFEAKRGEYQETLKKALPQIYRGKLEINTALELMGARMASDIKSRIASGIPPPNAPATLERKLALTRKGSTGSPKPLVDTGQLLSSITYALVKKEEEHH